MPQTTELDLSLNLDMSINMDLSDPMPDYDPLADVDYGHGMEADAKAELAALTQAMKQAANPDTARQFAKAKTTAIQRNDSEYWVAVCFQSRAQKEEFLRNARVTADDGDKYLDGVMLASKLGIALTPDTAPLLESGKIDPKLAKIARKGKTT